MGTKYESDNTRRVDVQDTSISLAEEQKLRSSSADMWPLYNLHSGNHDKELVERWNKQTDTTLTFAALFSIVDAIFLALAISGLRQNSTESLLAQISLQLAQPTSAPLPYVLPIRLTQLDIAVNALWTLSLVLSITCALAAHLVQQWNQEYLLHSQCHPTPSTRARIRAYLFDGLNQYRLEQVINAIPLLLHLAILLFGAGLIAYLFALHPIIAYTALAAYAVVGTSYLVLSISPLISLSSPFKTPISSLLWRALQLIRLTALYITQGIISISCSDSIFARFRLPKMISACRERYRGGFSRAIEDDLKRRHSNTDAYSLRWAISCMKGHGDLEPFITAIPRFLDAERHLYPEFTIGHLLEDPDVRLGWSIGRLLQTCASSSCPLEQHIRKGRAIACMRATWYITEKFAGVDTLYWDSLFGTETADSLSILRKDFDPDIAIVALCAAALAARSCLREFSRVLEWSQTKGPLWANRAQHLVGYIGKLSGGGALPLELDVVARDGPLIILGAFLNAMPFNMKEVDGDVSFMVNATVKHLTDGVRPAEATPDTQKHFSRVFSTCTYPGAYGESWGWQRYLDAAATQSVHQIVNGLEHQEPAETPEENQGTTGDLAMGGFPVPNAHWPPFGGTVLDRRRASCRSRWSSDSSRTAFSVGGDAVGNATALPSPGSITGCLARNESPLTTVVEVLSLPSRYENDA